jgi:threonine dehydrogenase-like Zn-dependent dehydrogenase
MLPERQQAVQLTAPDQLQLTLDKRISPPGPLQVLCRVQCVGLCYSDMKLLHQFDRHPRKSAILRHLSAEILAGIPSYVPGSAPTVPGHEAVVEVVAVGSEVTRVRAGGRYLVQADYRDLATAGSNAAFGYNFEGGLQEYVLLDERVMISADGEEYLVPVPEDRAASQLALIEPWACVEEAFAHEERRQLTPGGTTLLINAESLSCDLSALDLALPGRLLALGACPPGFTLLPAGEAPAIDDLLVVGADAAALETWFPRLKAQGLALLALAGRRFTRPLMLPLGRIHYGPVRLAATTSGRFAECLACIPENGELRQADHVHVIGAGGPMGVMAVARVIAGSRPGALIEGSVRNRDRRDALTQRVSPMASRQGVRLRLFDPNLEKPEGEVDYAILMAPVAELIQRAVEEAGAGGLINLFAGIPAQESCTIDLNRYAELGLYLLGTSGSTVDDMRAVLHKVLDGSLDTNLSVAAVSGMAGAIQGLEAVRDRTIAGKIVVYPELTALPLLELAALAERYPSVGRLLTNGAWNKAAEAELLRVAAV